MATATPKFNPKVQKRHAIRTAFSSFFGFIAVGLIITSVLAIWLDATLTNTNQYVNTVAPLVENPDVQNFVVDQTTDALLKGSDAPVRDVAGQLLGTSQDANKTDDQLKAEVTPLVKDQLLQVVSSPAFATLWADTNRQLHSSLIEQLKSNSDNFTLNLQPLITGVIAQLGTTKLAFVQDKLQLKPDSGQISVKGKQLDTVRKVYGYFQDAVWLIVLLTLLSIVLCVWLSVHHVKTARRVALATGIYAAVLALMLSASSLIKLGGQTADQQKLAAALVNGITHDLRLSLIILAAVCIAGAIGSKIYSEKFARKPAMTKRV